MSACTSLSPSQKTPLNHGTLKTTKNVIAKLFAKYFPAIYFHNNLNLPLAMKAARFFLKYMLNIYKNIQGSTNFVARIYKYFSARMCNNK